MATDLAHLLVSLTNSRLQSQNNALYQTIKGLINALQSNQAIQGRAAPTPHAPTHYASGVDPVDILQLDGYENTGSKFLRDDGTWQIGTGSGINELTGDVAAGPGVGSQVATLANTGVVPGAYTNADITVDAKGRITIAANGAGAGITQLTGDVTAGPGSGSQAATIPNDTVTYAKMQNVSAAERLLGRGAGGGAGDIQEISLGTGLSFAGAVLSASGVTVNVITAVPSADTTSTANTVVDITGMSFSLTAGTWLIWGSVVISGVSQTYCAIYLTDSADAIQAAGQSSIFINGSNVGVPIGPFVLTVAATETYKMRFVTGQNNSTALELDSVNSAPCSFMAAMQLS